MEEYFPAPERRYPSPSAQRRSGEHWKARFGLGMVITLTLVSAAIMFRIAGLGVGSATSVLRGQPATAGRPVAAATAPSATGQVPGSQPAVAQPTAAPAAAQPAAAAPAAAAPTVAAPTAAAPSPTPRPGQREYTVQGGDTLFAIAQRNSTTVDALVAANNLRSRDATLSIGQKLVIP